MKRPLIVVGEAVAAMANGEDAAVEGDPVERRGLSHRDAGAARA